MSSASYPNVEADGQPFTSQVMGREELVKWILRRLGSPLWKVELTRPHIEDAIESAVRWFAAKKGVNKLGVMTLQGGKSEYTLAPEVDVVLDLIVEGPDSDLSLIWSPFLMQDEKVPYDVFAAPQSIGLYSSYVQVLQYIETAKRILSADFNWNQQGRSLFVSPAPSGTRRAVVQFKSSVFNIEDLAERDHDMLKRYALAMAQRDLAMVWGKWSGAVPAAQSTQQLNWDMILTMSKESLEKLDEEILLSGYPMLFVTG